ncbi:MAG: phosphoenolpyruvate synthase [Alphaproteobacteria bacterium]|nr:phosphoenolpyruvate synthase [Alphaproteobacteria bacterium]
MGAKHKSYSANEDELNGFFDSRSKAEVLDNLRSRIRSAIILPQVTIKVSEWKGNKEAGIERVCLGLFNQKIQESTNFPFSLIVRSSAQCEDQHGHSMAGAYDSVLHVSSIQNLVNGIEHVIASYETENPDNSIFVQPMLQNVALSGVAFTCDPSTLAPYTVIDYVLGEDTTAVTAGKANSGKTFYLHHAYPHLIPDHLKQILSLCDELINITAEPNLDIEFGQDKEGKLYLFQVRPFYSGQQKELQSTLAERRARQEVALKDVAQLVSRLNKKIPYVKGKKTLLGNMPDWNPAEMIGLRPRPLALSMYKEMITDRIWAYQRDNYGYKNLRSVPLLYSLAGSPYIDVRASFYSFIPKMVSESLATKLVDYYLSKLEQQPELHDKVEFDIVFSCYTPSAAANINCLSDFGFSQADMAELVVALRDLTNRMTHTETGEWRIDRGKIDILKQRQRKLSQENLEPYDYLFWLAEDCKRYGTLAFAGLARAAFVATQFLNSMRDTGIISQQRYHDFWHSLETIGGNLKRDVSFLDRTTFIERYGHLRPGTYDILSESYEEAPEKYFNWTQAERVDYSTPVPFTLSAEEDRDIQNMLNEHGLQHTSESLFRFFRTAIEGREYGKFVFSWSIHAILKQLIMVGEQYGFSRDDCSYLDFQTLLQGYSYSDSLKNIMFDSIEKGREKYQTTLQILLPSLIKNGNDIWAFEQANGTPNYVTLGHVFGDVVMVNSETNHASLRGKIALITNADPGYDWILGTGLRGFVTCYGGANSHMAVRAMELNLPAVIGAGERLFQKWKQAKTLELDCAGKRVSILT